ncbi:FAD-dependent monooxygenase [Novosphingobium sp. AP12]|uniref:FAD-dependent monooxygenase n=1 Tax=Novosphingobium sp. AP12 TaxID=1144305 RepID=UPI000271FBBF|nr:FAD-dependent monooxygenase [Novosphingobium sp. AP12]EJL22712.1 2-polyprenyl-6-methoxyphenol hydroxylase-like oxidoreductase [Novosphingobium sp. AP12]
MASPVIPPTGSAPPVTRLSTSAHNRNRRANGRGEAVIVGASLAGLMAALTLSRRGIGVTLLERSDESGRTGAALQADEHLLERLTGQAVRSIAPGIQTWFHVHGALREAIAIDPAIRLHQHSAVDTVGQDGDCAWAITSDGRKYGADIVVGADGYCSVVRRSVAPEKPDTEFAGYLIWLGLVDEAALHARMPTDTAYLENGSYTFLGYPLPGEDGSRARGRRRLGWAWYDAGRQDLLRETGAVADNVVRRSLTPDDIPESVFHDLAVKAGRLWPRPWREAVADCVKRRSIIATPIAEYLPDRLVNRRLCLVGDAAHVPTPMTGGGFTASLIDAEILAEALDGSIARGSVVPALLRYEKLRLADVRKLVRSGQDFSRAFAAGAQ